MADQAGPRAVDAVGTRQRTRAGVHLIIRHRPGRALGLHH